MKKLKICEMQGALGGKKLVKVGDTACATVAIAGLLPGVGGLGVFIFAGAICAWWSMGSLLWG